MSVRAVLWQETDARAVADRLRHDGFEVSLARDWFAGEDDDEDHPWVVRTDAPAVLVELLLETHDGWLDDDPDPPATLPPPVELPDGPRRVKGHFTDEIG